MHSLGLDLSDRATARAVVVDDRGAIVAKGSGADAGDAVHSVTHVHVPEIAGVASPADQADVPVPGIRVVARCTPGAAAVAAEQWIGAARGARHAVCLHIGDEVFAGLLLDGKPWSGAHNRAGAAAWLALNPVERQDYRRQGSLAAGGQQPQSPASEQPAVLLGGEDDDRDALDPVRARTFLQNDEVEPRRRGHP